MKQDEYKLLVDEFSEDEVERALKYLETAGQMDIVGFIIGANRMIVERNVIENTLRGFQSAAPSLAERVRDQITALRQENAELRSILRQWPSIVTEIEELVYDDAGKNRVLALIKSYRDERNNAE